MKPPTCGTPDLIDWPKWRNAHCTIKTRITNSDMAVNGKKAKSFRNTAPLEDTVRQKMFGLAVDDEQNAGDQCTDSCNDVKYCTKTYAKKAQSGDDQKYSKQDPFQLTHMHFISPLNYSFMELLSTKTLVPVVQHIDISAVATCPYRHRL